MNLLSPQLFQSNTVANGLGATLNTEISLNVSDSYLLPVTRADGNSKLVWVNLRKLRDVLSILSILNMLDLFEYSKQGFPEAGEIGDGHFASKGLQHEFPAGKTGDLFEGLQVNL